MKLKVNWLEDVLGSDWEISPAGGATGEAFYAEKNGKKLFLKRNSSPFLAVLSAEGIVPKLVWTKRMENGDVITAQHWLNGRGLKPKDMKNEHVAELLKKIHRSYELLDMLKRLGKEPLSPETLLENVKKAANLELLELSVIRQALCYLEQNVTEVQHKEAVVCHCDIHHNNWLLSEDNQLYLIDWDGAMIADPAIDLGMLLYTYIHESEWDEWLKKYGADLTDDLKVRMHWYMLAQVILSISFLRKKNNEKEMAEQLEFLNALLRKGH